MIKSATQTTIGLSPQCKCLGDYVGKTDDYRLSQRGIKIK